MKSAGKNTSGRLVLKKTTIAYLNLQQMRLAAGGHEAPNTECCTDNSTIDLTTRGGGITPSRNMLPNEQDATN